MLEFLRCVKESSINDGKELDAVMQYKPSKYKQPELCFWFSSSDDAVLCEIGTERISQVLLESMAARASASNDSRMKELVTIPFLGRMAFVALGNGSRFLRHM